MPLLILQSFVDASFDHITSTDHALALLAQFTEVLQRDALQQQLEGKWMVGGAAVVGMGVAGQLLQLTCIVTKILQWRMFLWAPVPCFGMG